MKMTGMRITVMSTRFGVNQSTVSLCRASVDSIVYFMLSSLYETMWYFIFRYVINTAMIHSRFVYLCVRLFLGHIWVFYASYFVLKIWVWHKWNNFEYKPVRDHEDLHLIHCPFFHLDILANPRRMHLKSNTGFGQTWSNGKLNYLKWKTFEYKVVRDHQDPKILYRPSFHLRKSK